ncbi:MAG: alpha/beta fold hydrolase [Pseudomonadales bacterium]|nr:alpha/beta fold hydrolase [Pseudomonadales bacterium]
MSQISKPLPDWFDEIYQQPSEHTVDVAGCDIHYLAWGQRSQPGILFVHGRMSHARCWGFIAPFLAQRYRCVAIDLSGMGVSGHRERYTYANRVQELNAVAEASGLFENKSGPFLVTHSYGAVVGVKAMLEAACPFAGLVACDPSITHPEQWDEQTPRVDGPNLQRPHRTFATLAEGVARFKLAPEQISFEPSLEEYIAVHSLREVAGGWQWKFDPYVYSDKEEGHNDWWIDHTREFVAVEAPKAIIYGGKSAFVDARTAAGVATATQQYVPTVEIPFAHHHLMVDQPVALVTAIEAMMRELSQCSAEEAGA